MAALSKSDNLKIRQSDYSSSGKLLAKAGIRVSPSRAAILENLLGRMDHPTAEQVYQSLAARLPTLSRTTVYATLRLLCEKGLANQIPTGENEMRFDGNLHLHAHALCERCGRLFDAPLVAGTLPQVELPQGFAARRSQLVYNGICAACREIQ